MSNYEYKTVALARTVEKRRKRRQSDADVVAEQLGSALNEEAVDGWEYMRAETLTTPARSGWVHKTKAGTYVVLIFRRLRDAAWRRDEAPAEIARSAARAQEEETVQVVRATPPPREPEVAVAPAPAPAPVTPDIRIASASGTATTKTEPTIGDGSVTPIRPPLGSAQD